MLLRMFGQITNNFFLKRFIPATRLVGYEEWLTRKRWSRSERGRPRTGAGSPATRTPKRTE